jgi:hypothetical protein
MHFEEVRNGMGGLIPSKIHIAYFVSEQYFHLPQNTIDPLALLARRMPPTARKKKGESSREGWTRSQVHS